MKINSKQLRKMILQEMHDMGHGHMHGKKMHSMKHSHGDHSHDHHELLDVVMHAAGGCPMKAHSLLHSMMQRIEPEAREKEMSMHRDVPNPATSGVIPHGEELMGDETRMEEKKATGYRGAGHSVGILGPGFR